MYLDSLIESHESGCICFTTDNVKYTFVSNYETNSESVGSGIPFFKGGFIQKCIAEKKKILASLDYEGYGEIIRGCLWPKIENGEAKGVYGIVLPRSCGFEDIVGVWLGLPVSKAPASLYTLDKIEYRFRLKVAAKDKKLQKIRPEKKVNPGVGSKWSAPAGLIEEGGYDRAAAGYKL
jgi:hypothetical protein